jgi:hypothetical protein
MSELIGFKPTNAVQQHRFDLIQRARRVGLNIFGWGMKRPIEEVGLTDVEMSWEECEQRVVRAEASKKPKGGRPTTRPAAPSKRSHALPRKSALLRALIV